MVLVVIYVALIIWGIHLLVKYVRGKVGLEVDWRANLKGKVAIVTGANTGMGLQTALALARMGATVFVAARKKVENEPKVETTIEGIKEETGNQNVFFLELDLSSPSSIDNFVSQFAEKSKRTLDLLVNNAGVCLPFYKPVKEFSDCEMTVAVNFLGHFSNKKKTKHYKKSSCCSHFFFLFERIDGKADSFFERNFKSEQKERENSFCFFRVTQAFKEASDRKSGRRHSQIVGKVFWKLDWNACLWNFKGFLFPRFSFFYSLKTTKKSFSF